MMKILKRGKLLVFCALLCAFGGWTGAQALFSFLFSCLVVWKLLVPLTLAGWPASWMAFVAVSVLTAVIMYLVAGPTRKGAAATLGALLGVLGAWYVSEGVSPLVYLAAVIPHGIFELPALILAFATGLYVCGQVTRLCRRDKEALHVWDCLLLMSRVLFLALLPLLAAAAVVEAYVTPLVASLFL